MKVEPPFANCPSVMFARRLNCVRNQVLSTLQYITLNESFCVGQIKNYVACFVFSASYFRHDRIDSVKQSDKQLYFFYFGVDC